MLSLEAISVITAVIALVGAYIGKWIKAKLDAKGRDSERDLKLSEALSRLKEHEVILSELKKQTHDCDIKNAEMSTKIDMIIDSLRDVEEDFKEVIRIISRK